MIELSYELEPVKFHRYRSDVRSRIIYMDFNEETDSIRAGLLSYFNSCGIECYDDNKIVFECKIDGTIICYGFYDLKFSVGLRYYDENEKKGG